MLPLLWNINTKSLICLFFTKFYFLGSTYAPLTNSPLTNALVSAQSSINQGNTASLQTNTGTNGQQFVSYNGETYILQPRWDSSKFWCFLLLQKKEFCAQLNALKKRFKICHIYVTYLCIVKKTLLVFFVCFSFWVFNCWCMSEWAGPGTSKIFIVPTV